MSKGGNIALKASIVYCDAVSKAGMNLYVQSRSLGGLDFADPITLAQRIGSSPDAMNQLEEAFGHQFVQSAYEGKWVCAECGTELGRVNLFGMGGAVWSRLPFYCPGCGGRTAFNKVVVEDGVQTALVSPVSEEASS